MNDDELQERLEAMESGVKSHARVLLTHEDYMAAQRERIEKAEERIREVDRDLDRRCDSNSKRIDELEANEVQSATPKVRAELYVWGQKLIHEEDGECIFVSYPFREINGAIVVFPGSLETSNVSCDNLKPLEPNV